MGRSKSVARSAFVYVLPVFPVLTIRIRRGSLGVRKSLLYLPFAASAQLYAPPHFRPNQRQTLPCVPSLFILGTAAIVYCSVNSLLHIVTDDGTDLPTEG